MEFKRFITPPHLAIRFISGNYIFVLISFLTLVFLFVRAVAVPITHDEMATFYHFVQTGKFWPFIDITDGNNHLLNTLLTYLFYNAFGTSPLVLRLSNLAFAPLYFYFIFKLSQQLQTKVLGYSFFLTMALTLHYIEFLALSRGYGLAITFFAGSIWQFIVVIKTKKIKHIYWGFAFMFLTSTAILTLTYSYLLLLLLAILFYAFNNRATTIWGWIGLIGIGLVPAIFLIKFSLFVKSNGAYFDGNTLGLWTTTFKSFFMPLADLGFVKGNYYLIALTTIVAIPLLVFIFMLIKQGTKSLSYHLIFPYLLIGNTAITYISVKYLGMVYPGDRMSFYYYPLIVGSIIFMVDWAISKTKIRVFVVLVIPLLYFPIHFVKVFNTEYSVWYKYCHIPQRFYDKVMDGYEPGQIPPTVSSHGLLAYVWSSYINNSDKKASIITKEPHPNYHTKYEMIELKDFNGWQNYYDTIDYDRISNMHLLKANRELEKTSFLTLDSIRTNGKLTNEAFSICEIPIKVLKSKTIQIDFDLSFQSYKTLVYGGLVISIEDTLYKNLLWDDIFLNRLGDSWDGKAHNFITSLVMDVPAEAAVLKIYFWNIERREFSINGGDIKIYELTEIKPKNGI